MAAARRVPAIWGRAGASLFDCLDLLGAASSSGAETGFRQPPIREIGRYICRAHIHIDWYTNFADAPACVHPSGDLIYRYGKRAEDAQMMAHGAFAPFFSDAAGREFAASEVSCRADDASAEFRLNIASAYPKEANLGA
jgi:hypothetical protein